MKGSPARASASQTLTGPFFRRASTGDATIDTKTELPSWSSFVQHFPGHTTERNTWTCAQAEETGAGILSALHAQRQTLESARRGMDEVSLDLFTTAPGDNLLVPSCTAYAYDNRELPDLLAL